MLPSCCIISISQNTLNVLSCFVSACPSEPQFAMSRPGPRSWLRMAAGLPFLPMVKPGFWSCISSMRCVLMCCFMLYRWINLLNRQNNIFREEIYQPVNRLQSFLSSSHLVIWSSGHPVIRSSGYLVIW